MDYGKLKRYGWGGSPCTDSLEITDHKDRRGDYCSDTEPEVVTFKVEGYSCNEATKTCKKNVGGRMRTYRRFPHGSAPNVMGYAGGSLVISRNQAARARCHVLNAPKQLVAARELMLDVEYEAYTDPCTSGFADRTRRKVPGGLYRLPYCTTKVGKCTADGCSCKDSIHVRRELTSDSGGKHETALAPHPFCHHGQPHVARRVSHATLCAHAGGEERKPAQWHGAHIAPFTNHTPRHTHQPVRPCCVHRRTAHCPCRACCWFLHPRSSAASC